MTNSDNRAVSCAVDAAGELTTCSVAPASGLAAPGGLAVQGQRAYVTNLADHTLAVCAIGSDTERGLLRQCVASNPGGLLGSPLGVAIAGAHLYVSNSDGGLVSCELDGAGLPASCRDATVDGEFNTPTGVAVHAGKIFVASQRDNTVEVCSPTGSAPSSLSPCVVDDGGGTFAKPSALAISGDWLFATNTYDSSITTCRIAWDGALADCRKSGHLDALEWPVGIAVNGPVLYVSNARTDSVAICRVDRRGAVEGCEAVGAPGVFAHPTGVAFTPAASR